jgi:hypothetical protein|tara:strand:- start:1566 stop:1799 length:234 start_codon:yes stop_codon:yes gene_type:complete
LGDGLFVCRFVIVKIIKEIVHFLFDLDGDVVIQGYMVLGLDGGTTEKRNNAYEREGLEETLHDTKGKPIFPKDATEY